MKLIFINSFYINNALLKIGFGQILTIAYLIKNGLQVFHKIKNETRHYYPSQLCIFGFIIKFVTCQFKHKNCMTVEVFNEFLLE